MTTAIKEYKEMSIVVYENLLWKEGESIITDIPLEKLDELITNNKFIKIWTRRISTFRINWRDKIKVWPIEQHILSMPTDIQKVLRHREDRKWKNLGKWFESTEEIDNFISWKIKW